MYPKKGPLHPRFFNEVLEAIATLKETKGSTKKNIVDQVEHILSKRIRRLRHDSSQIQRALKHGVTSGLIKSKNGKYVLGMNQKDYGMFRKLQKLSSGGDLVRQVRRRKGKKRRKRKPRRRRRHSDISDTDDPEEDDFDDDEDDDDEASKGSDTCVSPGSGSPEDRSRRRGRKRRKRRRTRRRRRSDGVIDIHEAVENTENNKSSKSSDEESMKIENNASDGERIENDKPPSPKKYENGEEPVDVIDENQCDKPECLCNSRKSHQ